MGFLDALASYAPGITAASQGLSGAFEAARERRKADREEALAALQLIRQQKLDEQTQLMNQARLGELQSQAALRESQLLSRRRAYEFLASKDPEIAKAGYDDNMPWDTMMKDWFDKERVTRKFTQDQTANFLRGKQQFGAEPEYQNITAPVPGLDYGDINAGITTRRAQAFSQAQQQRAFEQSNAHLAQTFANQNALADKRIAAAVEAAKQAVLNRNPTEFQNKGALLYDRAVQAAETIDRLTTDTTKTVVDPVTGQERHPLKAPSPRSLLGNIPIAGQALISEDQQLLNDASQTLGLVLARLESGAAIAPWEKRAYLQAFTPRPFDGEKLLEAKAKKRAEFNQRLGSAAWRALLQEGPQGSIGARPTAAPSETTSITPRRTTTTTPGTTTTAHPGWRKLTPQEVLQYKRIGYTDAQIRQAYGPQ